MRFVAASNSWKPFPRSGSEVNAPGLSARAGVLTGEAAVNYGPDGESMIAGDLINTASRLQTAAGRGHRAGRRRHIPGSQPRDRVRRRESLVLKGKDEPVRAYRALRVVGQRKGVGPRRGHRSAVCRQRRAAKSTEGFARRPRSRPTSAARLCDRDSGHRQEPACLGVQEVRRRSRRKHLLARGSQPRVRRRRQLLGALGNGAYALLDPRGRRRRHGEAEVVDDV